MKRASIFLMGFLFFVLSLVLLIDKTNAQPFPDLVVSKIECACPQGKLAFEVINKSNVPLPKGWKAIAEVYFGKVKKGHVGLGSPTQGDITPAGGTARYVTLFHIGDPVIVGVVADATNSIKESNEKNNSLSAEVKPCGIDLKKPKPDLIVERIWGEFNPGAYYAGGHKNYDIYFTIRNIGSYFNGTLTITASVSPAPSPYPYIRITYGGSLLIGNPLVISGFHLSPGAVLKFSLEGPDKEWIGNTYNCTVSFSTDNPAEDSTNNKKTEKLTLPK